MSLTILTDESIIRRDECLKYHDQYDNVSFSPRPPPTEIKSGRSMEQTNLRMTPPKKLRSRGDLTPPRTPGRDRKASFSSFTVPSRSSRSHSMSSTSSGYVLEEPSTKTGYLQKNCKTVSALWVTRYFVVANGTLSCFSSESAFKNKNVDSPFSKNYNLRHFNLTVDYKKNLIMLHSKTNLVPELHSYKKNHAKETKFKLYVKNEDDLRNWEKSFQRHILYSNNCQEIKSKLFNLLSSLDAYGNDYESHKNTLSEHTESSRSSYHDANLSSSIK